MTTGASTAAAPVRFNPFSAEFRRDPYPMYRRLREHRPVHRTLGMWVLTRHADVRAVLRDRTFSAGLIPRQIRRQADRLGVPDTRRLHRLSVSSLVFTDEPDHGRLRALVNPVFTAKALDALRPRITAAADRLLARAHADGGFDAVTDLAAPLPLAVMGDWLGLPADVRPLVGGWTHDIRFILEPGLMRADDLTRVREVLDGFVAALADVIAQRRARPGEDLLSRLLAARTGAGDRLDDEEIAFVCVMCFVAGVETTASLLGNAVLGLVTHPDQGALLRRRPELTAAAVGETLRHDPPLQLTKRLATRDVEIGGEWIRAGDEVLLCLGATGRDPAVFDRPDEFDLTRDTRDHLAFGHGMHGCLGGVLARAQAEIALGRLHHHLGDLAPLPGPEGEPTWQDHSFIIRGLTRLPLTVRGPR
ncbi:cytochrome P450 [Frankia sp. AgB32]|uniref:cytochrome P450 n=1 Tax=Frankia sp. AgB32 TaxID=631119 RepID=UPI00200D3521|nr:cytochrome P450 [Frankia sp. AgB32]MCK9893655.1 cytochrome P450 [Frankia sp. AgB32]